MRHVTERAARLAEPAWPALRQHGLCGGHLLTVRVMLRRNDRPTADRLRPMIRVLAFAANPAHARSRIGPFQVQVESRLHSSRALTNSQLCPDTSSQEGAPKYVSSLPPPAWSARVDRRRGPRRLPRAGEQAGPARPRVSRPSHRARIPDLAPGVSGSRAPEVHSAATAGPRPGWSRETSQGHDRAIARRCDGLGHPCRPQRGDDRGEHVSGVVRPQHQHGSCFEHHDRHAEECHAWPPSRPNSSAP